MQLTVGFYTRGLNIGAKVLEEKSLGGSESAFIYMAREFAKLGHDVKVFCNLDSEYLDVRRDSYGINWFDAREFPLLSMMFKFDVFFCYRFYTVFSSRLNSSLNILVNHDILNNNDALMTHLWQVDHLFNLSKFHVDQYIERIPELEGHIWQTKNGIDYEKLINVVKNGTKEKQNRFIYASRPERGLERLLVFWESIHSTLPNYELAICGYDLGGELIEKMPKEQIQYYKELKEYMSVVPGVKNYGSLTKENYWKLLASSKAMLYPTQFPEISCINALESMACGTPIISTNNFALIETVGKNGILIDGDPDSDEYKKKFIHNTIDLVNNTKRYKELSYDGKLWVKENYTWPTIAKQWEEKVFGLLKERYENNKKRISNQLIYMSDIVATKKLAEEDGGFSPFADEIIEKSQEFKEEYDKGSFHIFKSEADFKVDDRIGEIIKWVRDAKVNNVLDVGCHVGNFALNSSNFIPDLKVHGIDMSEGCIKRANDIANLNAKFRNNITFEVGSLQDYSADNKYDAVFAGELLEHILDTKSAVTKLESFVKEDGWIFITLPSGPWESINILNKEDLNRYHLHHFEFNDIKDIFGNKKDFLLRFIAKSLTERGDLIGWWLIKYKKDSSVVTGTVNYERKKFTRPYNKISCGIITYNEEDNLSKCLKSVNYIADEIIVCDTGSNDRTLQIANNFTNKVYSIGNNPDGDGLFNFAWARNETLSRATGEWFLWLDADEQLDQAKQLRKYLDSPIYKGYVIKQCHLILDMKEVQPDTPVRIFKTDKGIKFYGVIHEQAMQNLNDHIHPTLVLQDTKILHYGYTTESVRRQKCALRNIPLLLKDRKLNPNRGISLLLLMRDYINVANWEQECNNGMINEKAIKYLKTTILIWREEFRRNRKSQYYEMAISFYHQALEKLAHNQVLLDNKLPPINIAFALAGTAGELNNLNYKTKSYWFEDANEYREFMKEKVEELLVKMRYPEKQEVKKEA